MERRRQVVVGVVAAAITAQFLVPAVQLLGDRQARFGWQMYAGRPAVVMVEPLDQDGQVVDVGPWSARLRPEIDWEDHAPRILCDRYEHVAAVRISHSDEERVQVACP